MRLLPTKREGLTVYHADALSLCADLPPASVDLICTDPPYFRVKDEPWDRQWDTPEGFLAWVGELCGAFRKVLKPNGSLYLFASPDMGGRVECEVRGYFNVLNVITWQKPPFSTKAEMFRKEDMREFFPASERIVFAEQYLAERPFWSEALERAREAAGLTRQEVSERVVGTRSGACWNWEAGIRFPEAHHWNRCRDLFPALPEFDFIASDYEQGRRPFAVTDSVPYTDVWSFETVADYPGKHPCEKPVGLLAHIITTSSRPGALVLDCFCGSGSTGEAALSLGRRAILGDASEHWSQYAAARLDRRFGALPQTCGRTVKRRENGRQPVLLDL